MPSTTEAINYFLDNNILFGPGQGGQRRRRGYHGLEMTQNSMRTNWTFEEVTRSSRGSW